MTTHEIYRLVDELDNIMEKLGEAFEDDSPFLPKGEAVNNAIYRMAKIRNDLVNAAETMKSGGDD